MLNGTKKAAWLFLLEMPNSMSCNSANDGSILAVGKTILLLTDCTVINFIKFRFYIRKRFYGFSLDVL